MVEEIRVSKAPRWLPISVQLRMLFGGISNQAGWMILGFAMLFLWPYGGADALHDLVFIRGEWAETKATITSFETNYKSIADIEIYNFHFLVDSVSFSGSSEARSGTYKEDQSVTIEYSVDDPGHSRIKRPPLDNEFFLYLILTAILIALGLIVSGIRKGLKSIRLMRTGKHTIGKLLKRTYDGKTTNEELVFKYIFEFEADDGKIYQVSAKTHKARLFIGKEGEDKPDASFHAVKKEEIREPLLYNPNNQKDAVLLDALPGKPRFNQNGEIKNMIFQVIPNLILPGLSIILHSYLALRILEIL